MNLEGVSGFRTLAIPLTGAGAAPAAAGAAGAAGATGAAGAAGAATAADFPKVLMDGVRQVNQTQIDSGRQVAGFLDGNGPELHTLMLGVEQANLSLEFAVQVRNKIVEAYNEIMRMQV